MDEIPAAIVIGSATLILSIIAGFNDNLGKFLFAFMLIFVFAWFIAQMSSPTSPVKRWGAIAGISLGGPPK
jgi:hypothetical protein